MHRISPIYFSFLFTAGFLFLLVSGDRVFAAEVRALSKGEVVAFQPRLANGQLVLSVFDGAEPQNGPFSPADVRFVVEPGAKVAELGLAISNPPSGVSGPAWILPQDGDKDEHLILGFDTRALAGEWEDGEVVLRLVKAQTPQAGAVLLYDTEPDSGSGGPLLLLRSGDSTRDRFALPVGHERALTWVFTQPGLYLLDVEVCGVHRGPTPAQGLLCTQPVTYAFEVAAASIAETETATVTPTLPTSTAIPTQTATSTATAAMLVNSTPRPTSTATLTPTTTPSATATVTPTASASPTPQATTQATELRADNEDGGVAISVDGGGLQLRFDGVRDGRRILKGDLPQVTVVSLSDSDWHVSISSTDFVHSSRPEVRFGANNLGWLPRVLSSTLKAPARVDAGPLVAPGPGASDGFAGAAKTLASSRDGGLGTAVLTAGLTLEIPVSTPLGSYSSILTISVFND